jgi:hypothetical protein
LFKPEGKVWPLTSRFSGRTRGHAFEQRQSSRTAGSPLNARSLDMDHPKTRSRAPTANFMGFKVYGCRLRGRCCFWGLLLPFLLSGCQSETPRVPESGIQFRAVSDAGPDSEGDIRFSLENSSDSTVFLLSCGEDVHMNIELRENGHWREVPIGCQGIHDLAPRPLLPHSVTSGRHHWSWSGQFRLKAFIVDSTGTQLDEVYSPVWEIP